MTFEGSYKAPDNSDVLPITHRSFDNDAIMFTDTPGSTLTLRGRKSGHGVKIDFEGFKYIGVWSAANDAPFVALEPGPVTPPWTPRTMSLSTRSTPSTWLPALPINAALASPCSRGSAARSMLRAVQSDNLSFKRQGIDLLVMPCLFHANLFALGGARWHRQNIDVPNDYRVSINFSSLRCAAGRWRISC